MRRHEHSSELLRGTVLSSSEAECPRKPACPCAASRVWPRLRPHLNKSRASPQVGGWEEFSAEGGCARPVACDREVMDQEGTDTEQLLLRWRQGELDALALYGAVRGPMYQSARRGVSSITSSNPDPHDVEEAVHEAFLQLREKDPADVSTVIGLARMIALRRGQDIGRRVVREREEMRELLANPLALAAVEFSDQDVCAAEEDEKMLAMAMDCFERLNADQRDLVEKTVMGHEQLSDWAFRKGTSHQAASRQRTRAIEAIKRCVASKRSRETTGRQVTP